MERQGRYRVKADANQREISDALVVAGYVVHDTHAIGHGYPDLAVNAHGTIVLLEVKTAEGRLTQDEREFFRLWEGAPVYVVRSAEEALEVVCRFRDCKPSASRQT